MRGGDQHEPVCRIGAPSGQGSASRNTAALDSFRGRPENSRCLTLNRPGENRAATGGCTPDSAAHVKPEHPAGAPRPWPSVKTPTVRTDRPTGPTPSTMRPWTPRHHGLQRYKVTHHGTEQKRPASTRIRS